MLPTFWAKVVKAASGIFPVDLEMREFLGFCLELLHLDALKVGRFA